MSIFITGLAMTVASPGLVKAGHKAQHHRWGSWMLPAGYAIGVLGPLMLLCTFIDMAKLLGCLLLIGGPAWFYERSRVRRGSRFTEGFTAFLIDLVPVALVVVCLRGFGYELYTIPSSSMRPTLNVGDVVLVNKHVYGLRNPFTNRRVFEWGRPERGDIIVFKFPLDMTQTYVKRVIGLPGDEIRFSGNELFINGRPLAASWYGKYEYPSDQGGDPVEASLGDEVVGVQAHRLIKSASASGSDNFKDFPVAAGCAKSEAFIVCNIPPDSYFVVGDNRTDSLDSRFWGVVNDELILGRKDETLFNTRPSQLGKVVLR